jgi:hypothetical protein
MTKTQALAETIRRANAIFERELEVSELTLIDLNASGAEIEAAIGPDGYMRQLLEASRDEQIAAVAAWLSGTDNTLH